MLCAYTGKAHILYICFVQTAVGFIVEPMQRSKETCQCALTFQNLNKFDVSGE